MKYYVDNNAHGNGNGSSWGSAWNSFSSIDWSVTKPGDTVYISGGSTSQTYNETLNVGASGSASGKITITKGTDPGHNGDVILDGGNHLSAGVVLNGKNHVEVSNLDVKNFAGAGFVVKNATAGVLVEHNSVYSGDPGGGNARGYDVRNSSGHDAVVVRENSFSTPTNTAAQTDGIWSSGNNGVLFENNHIVISNSNMSGHSDGIQSFQDFNITVKGNLFEQANSAPYNNHGAWLSNTRDGGTISFHDNVVKTPNLTQDSAVTHWAESSWTEHGSADIFNNTIIGGGRALNFENSPDVEIYNNVLQPSSGGVAIYSAAGSPAPSHVDYNQFPGSSNVVARLGGSDLTWSQWQAKGYDAHGVLGVNAAPAPAPQASSAPEVPGTTDTLVLRVSEDAWQGDAQFIVKVDGTQVGGINTVTASHAAGQTQDVVLTGNWGHGQHQMTVDFINDAWGGTPSTDRNLHVEGILANGVAQSDDHATLFSSGPVHFDVLIA
ncbi:hypothetical protein D9599_22480 [Roseomonas sp. KE2513]|uniref:carbohydrate-binding domain-containing protein n=1 Tax=Roseomonas sp. KE2513 TaxID=2479202 RepID=UPI0018DFE956|nr:carbohydrate-binding domain-containing protein [Roseomonas sp. KE2513]MBI0538334.1 hypothetical protein [Roseomonas sp. KE2513]